MTDLFGTPPLVEFPPSGMVNRFPCFFCWIFFFPLCYERVRKLSHAPESPFLYLPNVFFFLSFLLPIGFFFDFSPFSSPLSPSDLTPTKGQCPLFPHFPFSFTTIVDSTSATLLPGSARPSTCSSTEGGVFLFFLSLISLPCLSFHF